MVDRVLQPFITGSVTWNPPSVANGAAASTTVTVAGAIPGDFTLASFTNNLLGLSMTSYVSGADTVTVVLMNNTGGAVDLASGTLNVRLWPQ